MNAPGSNQVDVDVIVLNGIVLTMDDDFSVIDDGAVAIAGEDIVDVGERDDILSEYKTDRVISANGGFIMPGLINTHTHAAMTLFRGAADDLELGDFLERVWGLESQWINEESVALGSQVGFAEMLLSGTTCCADMYWHPAVTANVAEELGMRLVSGEIFIDFPGADGVAEWQERVRKAELFIDSYSSSALITPVLCPHSVYTVSKPHLTELAEIASAGNVGVHIHASEAAFEIDAVLEKYGDTPIGVLEETGLLKEKTWLAHAVMVEQQDMEKIKEAGVSVAHCPVSNMKMASGCAPVPEYRRVGIEVGLGTDGPSTSNDLNMWMVMRVAGLMQKNLHGKAPLLAAKEIVYMATRGGAKLLGLDDRIGSLEPGKAADLIVLSCNQPHSVISYIPYSHLVYAARPDDVRFVLVNGRVVVEEGLMTTGNSLEFVYQAREFVERIKSNNDMNLGL